MGRISGNSPIQPHKRHDGPRKVEPDKKLQGVGTIPSVRQPFVPEAVQKKDFAKLSEESSAILRWNKLDPGISVHELQNKIDKASSPDDVNGVRAQFDLVMLELLATRVRGHSHE